MITTYDKAMLILRELSQIGTAYIVGGAVRDTILGIEPKDYDIATDVPMDVIEGIFDTHDIGKNKDFGIVVVDVGGESFEVAQFRTDGEYSDNRRPDSVEMGVTFFQDTCRRDFTINAMGMDMNGNIYDFHGGQEDLKSKILRTVGEPKDRFSEDSLRMLRAIRFAGRFEMVIEKDTFDAIQVCSKDITKVSAERIYQELFNMAKENGEQFAYSIELLKETNLLYHFLPEIDVLESFKQNEDTHPEGPNVYIHVLSAIRANQIADPIVNLSILFHDVGKPLAYIEDDGRYHYRGHEKLGVEVVNAICDRLKIDNKTRDTLVFTCENHMKFHKLESMKVSKIIKLTDNENWDMLTKVSYADEICRGEELFSQSTWDNKMEYVNFVIEKFSDPSNRNNLPLDKIVSGKLVMELRNMTPCKDLGVIIKATKNWVYDNMIELDDLESIHNYIKNFSFEK